MMKYISWLINIIKFKFNKNGIKYIVSNDSLFSISSNKI